MPKSYETTHEIAHEIEFCMADYAGTMSLQQFKNNPLKAFREPLRAELARYREEKWHDFLFLKHIDQREKELAPLLQDEAPSLLSFMQPKTQYLPVPEEHEKVHGKVYYFCEGFTPIGDQETKAAQLVRLLLQRDLHKDVIKAIPKMAGHHLCSAAILQCLNEEVQEGLIQNQLPHFIYKIVGDGPQAVKILFAQAETLDRGATKLEYFKAVDMAKSEVKGQNSSPEQVAKMNEGFAKADKIMKQVASDKYIRRGYVAAHQPTSSKALNKRLRNSSGQMGFDSLYFAPLPGYDSIPISRDRQEVVKEFDGIFKGSMFVEQKCLQNGPDFNLSNTYLNPEGRPSAQGQQINDTPDRAAQKWEDDPDDAHTGFRADAPHP